MALTGGEQETTGVLIDRTGNEFSGPGNALILDATTSSDHRLQAEITSNPIESNKGDVTDHRRTKPATWSGTAILVDEADPTKAGDRSSAATDFGFDALESARLNGPQIERKALASLDFLKEIFASSETVEIRTDVDTYKNMVLESLGYRVLASLPLPGFRAEASAIEVTLSFREVRFATTDIVSVPKEPVKRQTGAKKPIAPPAPETASEADKNAGKESFLRLGARRGGLSIAQ